MYKFYPVLSHVTCISAQAVAASIATAVMGQSSTPASSVSVPWAQPRQPPTKPISSDVQVTHLQKKRPVEEQEDEPPAKQCLISKQGRVDLHCHCQLAVSTVVHTWHPHLLPVPCPVEEAELNLQRIAISY